MWALGVAWALDFSWTLRCTAIGEASCKVLFALLSGTLPFSAKTE